MEISDRTYDNTKIVNHHIIGLAGVTLQGKFTLERKLRVKLSKVRLRMVRLPRLVVH